MRNPAWSSDGSLVVYQKLDYAPRPQNQPLFSKNAARIRVCLIKFVSRVFFGWQIGDDDRLQRKRSLFSVVMDADGGHSRRIVDEKAGMAFAPSWSPDGEWIAFGFGIFFENGTKPARIMIVRTDGSQRRELTDSSVNSGFPSFSPDGKQIVYRVVGEHEQGLRILILRMARSAGSRPNQDNFPAWSPTGSVIEFTRAIDGATISFLSVPMAQT